MEPGLVSTIIPVYNRPALLHEAVASVLEQTYRKIEIIIVDDGSDDKDMPLALADCQKTGGKKVKVLSQPNRGPGAARQRGLEEAHGEYIQFLDSDDLLYPKKFQVSIDRFFQSPACGVVYGKTNNLAEKSKKKIPWKKTGQPLDFLFPSLLAGRVWDTTTPLYRRAVIDSAGGWSDLTNEEDWEFDARVAALGTRLAWVDEWVSEQRDIAPDRASSGGATDPRKLRDRARARELILESARKAGISADVPEFKEFVRYSFLVARQCALAGLGDQAEHLVRQLNDATPRALMRSYLIAGRFLGFARVTRLAESAYRLLRGRAGRIPA